MNNLLTPLVIGFLLLVGIVKATDTYFEKTSTHYVLPSLPPANSNPYSF
jgi:beta-xylosidase